ncbi:hypothetical protein ACTMTI_55225 [Nonomuraea sp. H19]|uniref:hypothetical protein n=1 Tax=Nonomuraea sp. H19 TaxID=3452206 RepID=UPI003F8CDDA1
MMEPTSADEAVEVFDLAVGDLLRTSAFKANKERMRTIKDLDGAAIMLREVWLKIRSVAEIPDGDIRAALDEMDLAAVHAAADDLARGIAAAQAEEADRLRQALAAEQQRREQAVTAAAVAEQAREAAAQARADAAGEADRLRTELTNATSALRTAHQQREEAVTAAAVAQALLHEQETSRVSRRSR